MDDDAELVLPDALEQDATIVARSAAPPLLKQWDEISNVECHDDPSFPSGQLQDFPVVKTVENPVLVQGKHVILAIPEHAADLCSRYVSVEEELWPVCVRHSTRDTLAAGRAS